MHDLSCSFFFTFFFHPSTKNRELTCLPCPALDPLRLNQLIKIKQTHTHTHTHAYQAQHEVKEGVREGWKHECVCVCVCVMETKCVSVKEREQATRPSLFFVSHFFFFFIRAFFFVPRVEVGGVLLKLEIYDHLVCVCVCVDERADVTLKTGEGLLPLCTCFPFFSLCA